ncbi:hypothetical protein ADM98_08850 [Exiguobacterium sp. BMC-KP]|uniref:hypothetical protein n=1 Tax=Exiguobacterium sp. BMC-KP TaxID=1684312 RepID=UPI0006AA5ADF|nr:hypothetical protein [Exiguobacterium sp. BMC-KP]KOP29016.1 hypothetical protein ADM98_08850 [Exiguobacterium sp. BMC-KP]
MILALLGLSIGLVTLTFGIYFIRSKYAEKTPLAGHADNVDNSESFLLGIILSIGVILFCSLTVRHYGYVCILGGLFILYGVSAAW